MHYNIYFPLPSLVDHRVEDNETLTDRDKPDRYALYFADTYTPKTRNAKKNKHSVKEIEKKYTKNTAADYEKTRKGDEVWKKEDALMIKLLAKHEPLRLLDVPVGTGRFLPLYEDLGIDVIGADISSDMLDEARKNDVAGELLLANASKLPFTDNMFDTTVCMRFFTWTNVKELNEIAAELRRVSTDRVIASAWVSSVSTRRGKTGPLVHSYEDWKNAWNNCKMTAYPIKNTRKGNYTLYDIDLKG
jgi:ubiquinone/menaquinone biosynthesis C-methylase UbiE